MIIRNLKSHDEFWEAEDFQRKVWKFDDRELIPMTELVAMSKHGAHVFGAFEKGKIVGFCFGEPGFSEGRVYHYSRMAGVLPDLRDKGLGFKLKIAQRALCLKDGLDLIRWTFDPLQSRNAYFNIEKLGVIIRTYYVNLYGTRSSNIFNRGLEADRFCPEWWIRSKRTADKLAGRRPGPAVAEVLDGGKIAPVLAGRAGPKGLSAPGTARAPGRHPRVSVEIPDSIDTIKLRDLRLARAWRAATRRALTGCFDRGYAVTGFATGADPAGGRRRSFYVLEKNFRIV